MSARPCPLEHPIIVFLNDLLTFGLSPISRTWVITNREQDHNIIILQSCVLIPRSNNTIVSLLQYFDKAASASICVTYVRGAKDTNCAESLFVLMFGPKHILRGSNADSLSTTPNNKEQDNDNNSALVDATR